MSSRTRQRLALVVLIALASFLSQRGQTSPADHPPTDATPYVMSRADY
jgi:hypothetical protein